MKKDTMLCIDLNTYLLVDAILKKGKTYHGDLTLDNKLHACFVETTLKSRYKRNVRIFDGNFITMTYRMKDGHIRLNFKEVNVGAGFNADNYAIGVMNEITKAFKKVL